VIGVEVGVIVIIILLCIRNRWESERASNYESDRASKYESERASNYHLNLQLEQLSTES